MAIAAIVVEVEPQTASRAGKALEEIDGVTGWQLAAPGRLAATVECPADKLPELLQRISDMRDALDLELVFVNYEDDLDEDGQILCPSLSGLHCKFRKPQ